MLFHQIIIQSVLQKNVIYHDKDTQYHEEISEFLSHCKWLPTATFYGFHAGTLNKQIISINN